MDADVKVSSEHLAELLHNEVIKRDVLDGDRAAAAGKLVRRAARRRQRQMEQGVEPAAAAAAIAPALHHAMTDVPAPVPLAPA